MGFNTIRMTVQRSDERPATIRKVADKTMDIVIDRFNYDTSGRDPSLTRRGCNRTMAINASDLFHLLKRQIRDFD